MHILVLLLLCEFAIGQSLLNELCTTSQHRVGRCALLEDCAIVLNKSDKDFINNTDVCNSSSKDNQEIVICCPVLENCDGCGKQAQDQIVNRIVGGSEAEPGSYPWAALLVYNVGRSVTRSLCGGVLINARHALTAAHCIEGLPRSWRVHKIRLGTVNMLDVLNCSNAKNDDACRQEFNIRRSVIHEQYDRGSNGHHNDIALLQLAEKIKTSAYIKPICLPLDNTIQTMSIENEQFTVVGWGETEKGNNSPALLEVSVTGKHLNICNEVFQNQGIELSDTQLCVGGEEGRDSCRGDSGGPLMRQVGGVWYLVGMVSFGDRTCGIKDQPSVYTNIVPYIDWIEHQMIESI